MFRTYFTYFIIGVLGLFFIGCAEEEALTFKLPKDAFEVVQHLPKSARAGANNALYLEPRRIRSNEFNSPALQTFVDSMYAVMVRTAGVGIAANQLGKRLQIFMIEAKVENPRYQVLGPVKKQIFINPKITKVSEKRKNFWHGCLSAKGEKRGNVASFEWIEYECQNLKGEKQKGRLEGFAAVIFQHEYRHMMKGTYLDHANHFLGREELSRKLDSGELPFFDFTTDTLPLLIEGYKIDTYLDEY